MASNHLDSQDWPHWAISRPESWPIKLTGRSECQKEPQDSIGVRSPRTRRPIPLRGCRDRIWLSQPPIYQLCHLGLTISGLCASAFPSLKWGDNTMLALLPYPPDNALILPGQRLPPGKTQSWQPHWGPDPWAAWSRLRPMESRLHTSPSR